MHSAKWNGHPPANPSEDQAAWLVDHAGAPKLALWTPDDSDYRGSWRVPGQEAKIYPDLMRLQGWSYGERIALPVHLQASGGLAVSCPHCGNAATFYPTSHLFIRNGVDYGPVWACMPCDHWTFCRRGSNEPAGPLLSSLERRQRMKSRAR